MDVAEIPMAIVLLTVVPAALLLSRWTARHQPAELEALITDALDAQPAPELAPVE